MFAATGALRIRRPKPYTLTRSDKRQMRSAAFDSARALCAVAGPEALARDFGLPFDSPEQLARDYGELKSRKDAKTTRAIREGALEGFREFAAGGQG